MSSSPRIRKWKTTLSKANRATDWMVYAQWVIQFAAGLAVIVAFATGWPTPVVWAILIGFMIVCGVKAADRAKTLSERGLWGVGLIAVMGVVVVWLSLRRYING